MDGLIVQNGTGYISSGISITGGSIDSGGYAKSNGLTSVNVRFTANATSATISGFPKPAVSANFVAVYVIRMDNNTVPNAFAWLSSAGVISLQGLVSSGSYAISAVYAHA